MTSGRVEMPKIDLVLTQDELAAIADDLLHAERVTIAYLRTRTRRSRRTQPRRSAACTRPR